MKKQTKKIFLLVIGDLFLLYTALAATLFFRYEKTIDQQLVRQHLIPFTIVFLIWLIFFGTFGLYDLRFAKNSKFFLLRLAQVMMVNTIVAILFFYILPFGIEPRRNLLIIVLFASAFIFIWRYLLNFTFVRAPLSRILFLGASKEAFALAGELLKNPQLGYKPVAFITAGNETVPHDLPMLDLTKNGLLVDVVRNNTIDMILILPEMKENQMFTQLLSQLIPLGIAVVEFSAFHEILTGKIPASLVDDVSFLENLVASRKRFYEFFKRGLDLCVALVLAIPVLIFFPCIALAIKLNSRGPIFFRQKRVGRNGAIFSVLKFRSMVKNAEQMSGYKGLPRMWGKGRDPRHTRVGSFLRKTYLDELPQIVNIVKGEMSLIGPRPERPEYVEELQEKVPFYEMRLLVPPGLSGWAQVNMENDASAEDAPEKMQYDLYYVKNRSFTLDLLIILKTIFILLQRQGR